MSTPLPLNGSEEIPDLGSGGADTHDAIVSLFKSLDQVYVGSDAETVVGNNNSGYSIGVDTGGTSVEIITVGGGGSNIPIEIDGVNISDVKNSVESIESRVETIEDDIVDAERLDSAVNESITDDPDNSYTVSESSPSNPTDGDIWHRVSEV